MLGRVFRHCCCCCCGCAEIVVVGVGGLSGGVRLEIDGGDGLEGSLKSVLSVVSSLTTTTTILPKRRNKTQSVIVVYMCVYVCVLSVVLRMVLYLSSSHLLYVYFLGVLSLFFFLRLIFFFFFCCRTFISARLLILLTMNRKVNLYPCVCALALGRCFWQGIMTAKGLACR